MTDTMTPSAPGSPDPFSGRWKTVITVVALVVAGKGLSFLREAFVASALGASSSSDGYYLALAIPTVVYSLGALPFSMWVTARLAALKGLGEWAQAASLYTRVLITVFGLGVIVALVLVGTSGVFVRLYAPGLADARLAQAVALTRIGALAIPALGAQAVCNGRLFADGRVLPVYVWLVISGLLGLGVVVWFTPSLGAAGAVWGFVAAGWSSILGPIVLARPTAWLPSKGRGLAWVDDLGPAVVYRALVMQLYFQVSLMLVYGFGSTLPAGELSAALFGSKIQTAVYETLAVTAGVLVYPRIAHLLQLMDQVAVKRTMIQALNWLLPATAGMVVLLITCRREIVGLVYERNAFDDRAARLVASGLLGYAPGIVGLTLVEIFHRAMVLRGRLSGYVVVFSCALLVNWVCYHFSVRALGVLGLTLSSSAGVLAAGIGLVVYASRRLESVDSGHLLLLMLRTATSAGLMLAALMALRATVSIRGTSLGQILTVLGSAVAGAAILSVALLALGHRWHAPARAKG